jgi:hypothetical protein
MERRTHWQASDVTLVLLSSKKSITSNSDARTWRQHPSNLFHKIYNQQQQQQQNNNNKTHTHTQTARLDWLFTQTGEQTER